MSGGRVAGSLLFACAAALSGCEGRGTVTIEFGFDGMCEGRTAADEARIYLIRNGNCDACACGACFDACSGGGCQLVCEGFCPADAVAGLAIAPDSPGTYAVVFEYYFRDSVGTAQLGASACALVEIDADGTADRVYTEGAGVSTSCCVMNDGTEPVRDAGLSEARGP